MTKGSNNNYKSAGPKNQFFIHFLLVRRIFAMHFARETFFQKMYETFEHNA